ncbi:peptidase M24 [Desulfosarcina variabilis str. Montpellier]|uniref:M24 family metallopeptidase n=1 Tax=Desulfosarcina variabilis TaxID=2300 RepID=UPI003AFAA759
MENQLNAIISQRIKAIRNALSPNNLDALMVSVQENRFYLSGFTGEDTQFDESAGVLIISDKDLILATDSRFELQARDEASGYDIVCYKKGLDQELPDILGPLGIRRLGFESVRLSHKNFATITKSLDQAGPPVTLVPTVDLVENLRQIKSEEEIGHTIEALRLAEKAFDQVLSTLCPGMTEKQVAWAMEKTMREMGAQGLSFPVIVASGPNSALPHAIPTDRKLKRGEPILIDWGARFHDYCSDTTRTVVMGRPVDPFNKVFKTVVEARDMAIAAIAAGISGTQVDKIARDHIDQNGFAGKFGHGLGHGTGLAVHESPRLSPIKDQRLESGMIVTVEPGIYLPEWGGIRMENQVVVRKDHAQVLNASTPFNPKLDV